MDLAGLKKARAPFRRQITKLVKSLQEELAKDPIDITRLNADFKLLQDYNEKLRNLDEQILAQLTQQLNAADMDDEDADVDGEEDEAESPPTEVDKEFDQAFKYQREISYVTTQLETLLTPRNRPSSPSSSGFTTAMGDGAGAKKKSHAKLPKIPLKKFSGHLSDWLGWWSQFSKIHNDEDLHAVDKFSYLSQSMVAGSRAKDLVDSFPMTAENYPEAIQALQDRYGQEDLLIPHYIRGILKLAIKNATTNEKMPLSSLYDKLETDIRALGTLEVTTKEMGRFLHPIVEACLNEEVFVAWQRSPLSEKDGSGEVPPKSKLDYMLQFLREESKREMKREQAREDFRWEETVKEQPDKTQNKDKKDKGKKDKAKSSEEIPTAAGLSSQSIKEKSGCIFCGKPNHASEACFKAKKMTFEEKKTIVTEKNACFACLRQGHRVNKCNAPISCTMCGLKHYEIMCKEIAAMKEQKRSEESSDFYFSKKEDSGTVTGCMGVQCLSDVLLKTLIVKMKNPANGKETTARLVFDDCSQRTYTVKKKLDLIGSKCIAKEESRIAMIDGSMTKYQPTNHHEILVSGIATGSKTVKIRVRERVQIGCPIPKIPAGAWMEKLKKEKIKIPDLVNNTHSDIDILIGGDYYESFRTGKRIQVADRLYAVETIFGWTLSGPIPNESGAASEVIQSFFCGEVNRLWDLETLGIQDPAEHETKMEHEDRVKKEFQQQIRQRENGRYVVRLPFKNKQAVVANNYEVAKKRLGNVTNKLESQGIYEAYHKIFMDWEQEEIIEKVPENELEIGCFSPHRPVLKPESETTPIRPVMDASCRVGKNPSLNMLLETGPNMLELIPSLLLRFRRRAVGVISDIRKAFLTIEVDKADRNFQKILWWNEDRNQLVEYRFTRVVFGMTCSPFILAAVLDFHLEKCGSKIAEILRKSFYVDNSVVSFDTPEEYRKFREEATAILERAKMILRQWESNCEQNREKEETSVLGLTWNKKEDSLSVKKPKMQFDGENEVTNRKVLSLIAQVFDPVGITCPSVLLPKLMLQKNIQKQKLWDQPWEPKEKQEFLQWYAEIEELMKIKIPRFAYKMYLSEDDQKEIHVCCDASMSSYACCAFIRTCNLENEVNVQLLMAKSRVAPMEKKSKKITIPRLELLACLIGSRMLVTIQEAMEENTPVFLWSDSSTCIAWITREEVWSVFVQNRVREIRKLTNSSDWRHIAGKWNPADLPSRGCSSSELLESRWWEGPSWMKLPAYQRPSSMLIINEDEVMVEKRKTEVSCIAVEKVQPKFSHYMKNVRTAAWIRRFIKNCKTTREKRNLSQHLSIQEIRKGEHDILLDLQKRHFVERPDVKGFNVELQEDGLWHLKTRLVYKRDTENFKYPIILPKDDPLVEQLVRYVHETSHHSGSQHVIGKLRERYWIIRGKPFIKKVIHKCVRCQRYRIEKMKVDPAPLPSNRVETTVAFQTTGIDLAGPLYLKGGRKVWIVLYTCAVYRCVHLDLVDSLSTEAFLLSLERFVNTVGRPHTIYTDNGTNFVGTSNLMKKLDWEKVTTKTGVLPINWIFIPPSAPWWGGWWERLVRSVKDLLKKMLGRSKLSFDELRTCLAAVSQVINDRPLTAVTADPEDLSPLTPSHFMRDLPVAFPEGEEIGVKFYRDSYQKVQEMKKALQARFRKEYLGFLTSRNCSETGQPPTVGCLVLVGDNNKRRFEWPLGRIQTLIPGKDGKLRVAIVKTVSGTLTRPLQRLYPLEIIEGVQKPPGPERRKKEQVSEEEYIKEQTTSKYGRKLRKPLRYGQWNHE